MDNIRLAENLRTLRLMHNLTQAELSEILSISRQAYSNYESSKRTPDFGLLMKLTTHYKISLDQLVFGDANNVISDTDAAYAYDDKDSSGNGKHYAMNDKERQLLDNFRSLCVTNQSAALDYLKYLEYKEKNTNS